MNRIFPGLCDTVGIPVTPVTKLHTVDLDIMQLYQNLANSPIKHKYYVSSTDYKRAKNTMNIISKNEDIQRSPELIAKQRKTSDEVLKKICKHYPETVIAGGAPRDWYFGYVGADIDIFIKANSVETVCKMLNKEGFTPVKVFDSASLPDEYRNQYMNGVIDFTYENQVFQIILIKIPHALYIETFPLSISCISYNSLGEFVTNADFNFSINHKVIYPIKKQKSTNESREKYLTKIYNKLSSRLPDYLWQPYKIYNHSLDNILNEDIEKSV